LEILNQQNSNVFFVIAISWILTIRESFFHAKFVSENTKGFLISKSFWP